MKLNRDEFIWSQKYRPTKIEDCILPTNTKNELLEIVKSGRISNHLLLANKQSGIGKTTAAIALCEELNVDYITINASLDANIDTLREVAKNHACTVSFNHDSQKAIIWEESDAISAKTQDALRAFIEEYSANCVHIFTANSENRIIPAIRSRCTKINFDISAEEKKKMLVAFMKRIFSILEAEGVEFDKRTVAKIIDKGFPDFRNILDFLRYHSLSGKIENNCLAEFNNESQIHDLINILKEKEWTQMRKWVIENSHIDAYSIIDGLYSSMDSFLSGQGMSEFILILSNYQTKLETDSNQEITISAMLTEAMMIDGFK